MVAHPAGHPAAHRRVTHEKLDCVVLSTETRVLCVDEASRRKFRRYKCVIRLFSGWIRRRGLAIVKEQSEKYVSNVDRSEDLLEAERSQNPSHFDTCRPG